MNLSDMREMTGDELVDALVEAKEEQFNLRFQVATNQLDNTSRITEVKKNIARLLTVMRERELASASAGTRSIEESEEAV
jgi:large subunit ribosomal protein L29